MTLDADLDLRRGALHLRANLQVAPGETVALVGPNGAGKSTSLQLLAGLLRVDAGRIAFGARVFDGGPAGPFVPPEARRCGFVFQQHLLLPHRSARDNVAYGPESRGLGRRRARRIAEQWLERVALPEALWASRPEQLSGGQCQRVALARALAAEPEMLLLDEPLSAVDATARLHLRRELQRHLRVFEGPRVLVAHDVADALALADRIVVLEAGEVAQQGTAAELVRRPRSQFVADLVGVNVFAGTCRDGAVSVAGVELRVASRIEGDVLVTVHPRAVSLFRERPAGSPRNVWSAPVEAVEPSLDRVRVRLGAPLPLVAEVTQGAVDELRLADGGEVWVAMKATELVVTAR